MLSYANVKRQTFPESEVGNLLYANFFYQKRRATPTNGTANKSQHNFNVNEN